MSESNKKEFYSNEIQTANCKDVAKQVNEDGYADNIKNAHATGIGSLGRNDEKLGVDDKEETGIIKD